MTHTHYDSLKIARDAPIEVIRAAYRALSLLYHPDRNPDDPVAAHAMALLNAAYEVLSEPEKRSEYDDWLRSAEAVSYPRAKTAPEIPRRSRREKSMFGHSADDSAALDPQDRWRNYAVWSAVVIAGLVAVVGAVALYRAQDVPHPLTSMAVAPSETPTVRQSAATEARQLWPPPGAGSARSATSAPASESSVVPQAATPATAAKPAAPKKASEKDSAPKRVVRYGEGHPHADAAPNGERWPQRSSYVHGYPILSAGGGSQLVIDNSKNNFDVFLRLVALTGDDPKTVRSIFVVAHDQFTARRIESGTYEARYRQLQSGALMRSATFVFDESAIAGGTRYSIVTLELHGEPDDGANTYSLSDEEFGQ